METEPANGMPPATFRVLNINLSASFGGGPEHIRVLVKAISALSPNVEQFIAIPRESAYYAYFAELLGPDHLLDMPVRKFSLTALYRLCCFAKKNKIAILHSHGKGAGLYGRIAAFFSFARSVHTFHGIHIRYGRIAEKAYIFLERALARLTDACTAVSASEFAEAAKLGFSRPGALFLIPNGVEIPPVLSQDQHPSVFRVVHLSRFDDKVKNSEAVLAIALLLLKRYGLSGLHFVLVGEGNVREAIEERVRQEGISEYFSFYGYTPTPRKFLATAGCYLSTSLKEGLPLAVLEAMSEGVPVVASRVPGNADAVGEHEEAAGGFLFPVDDLAVAAEQIYTLSREKTLRYSLGRAARVRAREHFSSELMGRRVLDVYRRVLRQEVKVRDAS